MPTQPYSPALSIAQRVRTERLTRGWTQPQLAERAGLSVATYRLFERTGQISLHRLLAIASAFGFGPESFAFFPPSDAQRPLRQRGRRTSRAADRRNLRVRVVARDAEPQSDVMMMTPGERIEMLRSLTRSAWSFSGDATDAGAGLSRDVVRIKRRAR